MKIIELANDDELCVFNKNDNKILSLKCINGKMYYNEIENFNKEENIIIKDLDFNQLKMFINTFNLTADIPKENKRKKLFNELEDSAFDCLYGKDYGNFSSKIKSTKYQAIFQLYTSKELEKEEQDYKNIIVKNKEDAK